MGITARNILDNTDEKEIVLELLSYSGGENTISEDHIAKSNEARTCENWEAVSLGGMQRAKGFNQVSTAAGDDSSDLAHFHFEDSTGGGEFIGVIAGDLVKDDSGTVTVVEAGAFTADVLCHATKGEDDSWITNSTDNLLRYTIAGDVTTPASQPALARERVYRHKNRLVTEGGGVRIYGSRVGAGNWTAADAWSLANDAWNIDIPNDSKGCAIAFPSGDTITAFDEFRAYLLSGFPNTRYDPIANSRGCSAPYSIAIGDEGVYFVSKHPSLGVFLWTGTEFINLTAQNEDVFVEKINFSARIFGIYRDQKYYLFYNETGSGVSYTNRMRVYNAKFGSWMNRPVNSSLADNFGYPALLTDQSNELYVWSSRKKKIYELETDDDSDEGNNTEANYKTKDFTSADFMVKAGKNVPIDEALMKITKITLTYSGTVGVVTLQWTADRGRASGSLTFDLSAGGDLLNTTFTVNSSEIISSGDIADKKITKSVKNSAVGRTFNFQMLNNGTSTRPKIKKIKIHGLLLSED